MAKKTHEIPKEVDAELKSPKFEKPKTHTVMGYILDINEKDKKVANLLATDCTLSPFSNFVYPSHVFK